jgi:uncharacterized protein (TIGR03435 family)
LKQIGGCGVIAAMRLISLAVGTAMLSTVMAAQVPSPAASADRPTFEVASIRSNRSGASGGKADAAPNGRVIVTNSSLLELVRNGFELQRHELVLGERVPSWIETERWDIVAQGPPITGPTSQQQLRRMLQNLLIDRFSLVTTREVREIPAYALVLARNDRRLGPDLRPSTLDCAALVAAASKAAAPGTVRVCGRRSGPGFISTLGAPLADFARTLSVSAGRYVFDSTGLTGGFDLDLKWSPDPGTASAPLTDGASLFTAIQEQLGLRLEPRQAAVNAFVIESAQRPREE